MNCPHCGLQHQGHGKVIEDKVACIRELVRQRDELRAALAALEDAADVYAADQSRATDKRCGLVQPVTVAECEALNVAIRGARRTLLQHDLRFPGALARLVEATP